MGLDRKYVGEGYPLCSDLPAQHFLKQGATFILLGADPNPERHQDPSTWWDDAPKRLSLSADSNLGQKLCAKASRKKTAPCTFPAKVVLDEDIVCDGVECQLDSLRTFEVAPGIFYEYIRQPCVHQAFYNNAVLISRIRGTQGGSQGKYMCGDPRMESGSTSCCVAPADSSSSREGAELFSGERVSFDKASDRCTAIGKQLCLLPSLTSTECGSASSNGGCDRDGVEYWSTTPCGLRAKIDREGKVAIIHAPDGIANTNVEKMVQQNTKMFFRTDWENQASINALLQDYENECVAAGCETDPVDGYCVCDVSSVLDTPVYTSDTEIINTPIEELLSRMTIGALDPSETGTPVKEGVTKYLEGTVFQIVDHNGISHFRKNVKSYVGVGNGSLSFRNAVHFISLSDPEVRDALHETDAVLDQYLYHGNTAPFLATRFAQRFGISNPSPGYVTRIGTAFWTGRYEAGTFSFGSGKYGDLAATFAAVVLDREARNVVLDADPTHGALHEPYLKIVRTMRSLNFTSAQLTPMLYIYQNTQDTIGQQPHGLQSVFSFFKPQYQPAGKCFCSFGPPGLTMSYNFTLNFYFSFRRPSSRGSTH